MLAISRFIGSIKLAVPLLTLIAVVLIWATFYENQVGSPMVQREVYKSVWFGGLMFLLALNLMVSALSRYPWRGARKMGFALTHLGLIGIIAGSAAVIHLGVEGMLLLRTDGGPNQTIRTEGERLEVIAPKGQTDATEIFIKPTGEVVPDTLAGLSLGRYSQSSRQTVSFSAPEIAADPSSGTETIAPNPAGRLRLSSQKMAQSFEQWLAMTPATYRQVSLGPAQLELAIAKTEAELKQPFSAAGQDSFRLILGPEGELFYAARSSQGFKSGKLEVGKSITPGWADFEITLVEFIPQAQIQRQVVPAAAGVGGGPALEIQTPGGTTTWLPWGQPTTISDPSSDLGEEWLAAFSPNTLELPFAVTLKDFVVERNEGADSVAMWTSQIQLQDPESGQILHRSVWMNHPTWYRGWKLGQASWNPGDLQQSTLQVKREPLWVSLLTWGGSLLVVAGIGTMFYGPLLTKHLGGASTNRRSSRPDQLDQPASSPQPDLVNQPMSTSSR